MFLFQRVLDHHRVHDGAVPRYSDLLADVIILHLPYCHQVSCYLAKVGQIGPKMRQIRDLFRSDFSTFGFREQKCNEI